MTNADALSDIDTLMCFQVYALHHAFGRFYQEAFGDSGFTYPKFVALTVLDKEGPLSLGELAGRVGVEPNSLSPLTVDGIDDPLVHATRQDHLDHFDGRLIRHTFAVHKV